MVEALASNLRGRVPGEAPSLRRLLREAGGVPVDVRVSYRFVEAVFLREPGPWGMLALTGAAGPVVDVFVGEHFEGGWRDFLELLDAGLAWRAHTLAEAAWRERGRGEPARGLAVLAGALAKAQEGLLDAALRLLAKARAALGGGVASWPCMEEAVRATAAGGPVRPSRCLNAEAVASILGDARGGGLGALGPSPGGRVGPR